MADDNRIDAASVTKPIQLLAAWLIGLIAINGSFLGGASLIATPKWAAGALVGAAILNVPVFLLSLFLLQTRFRPEMQEDWFYAKHLERKYAEQSPKASAAPAAATQAASNLTVQIAAKRSRYLWINDLLPDYRAIVGAVADKGYRPSETFGSTSSEPVAPERFVISVGANVPTGFARQIIDAVKELGLDGVGVGDDEEDRSRLFVGAYSYDEAANFLPVTSADFTRLMDPQTTDRNFFRLLRKYEGAAEPG